MSVVRTIIQIGILFIFYYIGEGFVNILHLQLPGSIIGLLILWICLYKGWLNMKIVQDGASFLITFLTLFFIPTTVGIVKYPELLTKDGLLLVLAVFVSSIFAFVFTGKITEYLEKIEGKKGAKGE